VGERLHGHEVDHDFADVVAWVRAGVGRTLHVELRYPISVLQRCRSFPVFVQKPRKTDVFRGFWDFDANGFDSKLIRTPNWMLRGPPYSLSGYVRHNENFLLVSERSENPKRQRGPVSIHLAGDYPRWRFGLSRSQPRHIKGEALGLLISRTFHKYGDVLVVVVATITALFAVVVDFSSERPTANAQSALTVATETGITQSYL